MKSLLKPQHLKKGDTVATVSLSWGGAGDPQTLWRYRQGKERLEKLFGLRVIEMPHTLAGSDYLYRHPEKRAQDMMAAFSDPAVKAVFTCIGGEDTLRLLPFIDLDVIRNNPKIFIGYSDTTVNHYMCYQAGLSSFYGGSVLADFAENVELPAYTAEWMEKTLFRTDVIGSVPASECFTGEYLPWIVENRNTSRTFRPNSGYTVVQGHGTASGSLIGGCIEVLDWLRGTALFPQADDFCGALLFLETSEDKPLPRDFKYMLRSLGALGVFERINGILFAKPYGEVYRDEYHAELIKVLAEHGKSDMPVLANASFGHNEPKCCLPFGAMAEIDCDTKSFTILESGVV